MLGIGITEYYYSEISGISNVEILNYVKLEDPMFHPSIGLNTTYELSKCIWISINNRLFISNKFEGSVLNTNLILAYKF